jgi:hypothetical protein
MFECLAEARRMVEELVSSIDAELLSREQAVASLDEFSRLERICAAGRMLCGGRAIATNAHHGSGSRSAAEWLARRTGQSVGEAIGALETAKVLPSLPSLDSALRCGSISSPQAAAVAQGAGADPAALPSLLRAAEHEPLKRLREKARAVVASASSEDDQVDREEQLRKNRFLRTYVTREGAVRGEFALAPLEGARLLSALEVEERYFFEQARERGERESSAAYAADALVALADRQAGEGRRTAVVSLTVDAAALRRGHCEEGESCEIPGVGAVPVSTARTLLGESWLRLVVRNGVDVCSVTHLGRYVSAQLRSALELRDPRCVVPGCAETRHLEIDHYRVDFAAGGVTSLDNCARLCRHHHRLKTHHRFRIVGGPGKWRWLSPTDRPDDLLREGIPPGRPAGADATRPDLDRDLEQGEPVLAGVGAGSGAAPATLFG